MEVFQLIYLYNQLCWPLDHPKRYLSTTRDQVMQCQLILDSFLNKAHFLKNLQEFQNIFLIQIKRIFINKILESSAVWCLKADNKYSKVWSNQIYCEKTPMNNHEFTDDVWTCFNMWHFWLCKFPGLQSFWHQGWIFNKIRLNYSPFFWKSKKKNRKI